MTKNNSINLLKNLTPSVFLKKYWGKQALFLNNVIDISGAALSKRIVFNLIKSENIESKIISFEDGAIQTAYGPFNKIRDDKHHSLLIHKFNLIHQFSYDLFQSINFIPYCLHDDVMMSFSSKGGGVGPHSDSYDVFLIQGQGEKSWDIGVTDKKRFQSAAGSHNTNEFTSTQQFIAKPGDVLYVPPFTPHHGVSLTDDCVTYSIGFRSPSNSEIRNRYLEFLLDGNQQSNILFKDLRLDEHAKASIPDSLASFIKKNITIHNEPDRMNDFVGIFLSEPHDTAIFTKKKITEKTFRKIDIETMLYLDIHTRAVIHQNNFYINGEKVVVAKKNYIFFSALFNQKKMPITPNKANSDLAEAIIYLLSEGYITFKKYHFMI